METLKPLGALALIVLLWALVIVPPHTMSGGGGW